MITQFITLKHTPVILKTQPTIKIYILGSNIIFHHDLRFKIKIFLLSKACIALLMDQNHIHQLSIP